MMDLSSTPYAEIRDALLREGCSFRTLEHLKHSFRQEINSQRVFERIDSLFYLFKILEKRDAIGPNKVHNLIVIVNEMAPHNREIYKKLFGREPYYYNHSSITVPEARVLPPVSPNVIERINNLVQTSIGHKWRELARGLSITEGQIDLLEAQYRHIDVPRMVYEVLRIHQERCGTNYELWRSYLQSALVKARRTDLSEGIDEILRFNPIRA